MEALHDKKQQMEAAGRVGVDTPRTVFVDSREDLQRGADEIGFPAIFKPVESLAFKLRFHRHVLEIGDRDELARVYERVTDCGTLMLQEVVPGGDEELWSLGSYLDAASRPLALYTGHKLRQHPVRFGHCRMAVSRWDDEVSSAGVSLLQELRYHGVSQVEFKRDPRDGRYRFMEINARHWMWHSLAAASGVNLSLAAYRDATGHPYTAVRQVDGRKWVVAITDLRDAQAEFRRHERAVLPWLKSYAGVARDGVLSLRDPCPAWWPSAAPSEASPSTTTPRRPRTYELRTFCRPRGRHAAGGGVPGHLRQRPGRDPRPGSPRRARAGPGRQPAGPGLLLTLRRRHAVPLAQAGRGRLRRVPRGAGAATAPEGRDLPHARRVHLAAVAPRRAPRPWYCCPSAAGT